MAIKVLTPETAAQIAAGEVVERPASVVKELVENSLDAGASQIVVEVSGGGLKLIRVVDDGAGIPSADVETAFLRHATSKLTSSSDLEKIATLGFRGEALPSIASVSDMELLTRVESEQAGTRVRLQAGELMKREPVGRPRGTTVRVTHLFQNVPARLKFMKSVATENGRIGNLVTRYAMARPSVRFSLTIDGRKTLSTTGAGGLREAVSSVYGAETAAAMLELSGEEDGVGRIKGLAGPPTVSRAQTGYVTLVLNGRWIQDRRLNYAVEEAYQNLLMVGRRPVAVLLIEVSPEEVDVNVNPSKAEVRFKKDREMFSLVQRVVRQTLVESSPVHSAALAANFPSTTPDIYSRKTPLGSDLLGWASGPRIQAHNTPTAPTMFTKSTLPLLRVVGQVSNTYIVAEGPDGMYLVDQHAAHERVLFERVLKERSEKRVQVQGMLAPATVDLSPVQRESLAQVEELLRGHGFDVESFGDGAYVLRAVPAMLSSRAPDRAFLDVLDSLLDPASPEQSEERLAASIACHSAIRAGDVLQQASMEEVVRLLEQAQSPHTCPHGRPTLVHLSSSLLEKEFGRR